MVRRHICQFTLLRRYICQFTLVKRDIWQFALVRCDIWQFTLVRRDICQFTLVRRDIYQFTVATFQKRRKQLSPNSAKELSFAANSVFNSNNFIKDLHHPVVKMKGLENLSLWPKLNSFNVYISEYIIL